MLLSDQSITIRENRRDATWEVRVESENESEIIAFFLKRGHALGYAEFLSGNYSVESKFSAILNILSKQTMTIEEILQKEDEAAAEVGKLVTAYQATASEVADLQAQIVALQGTQVTDAQLQSLADKADAIKQSADAALPAPTPAPADTPTGTGTATPQTGA